MLDDPTWILEPHLRLLNEYILRLVRHQLPTSNLIVSMPPRHGKSTLLSKYTPAWFLGCWPNLQVLLATYGDEFAAQWGGKARDLVDEWGPKLMGITTRDDSSAKARWEIAGQGGGMQTAGIGGPLTGKGGHLKIIDDPVKDQEEAQSKTIQERNWDWYRSTFHTRSNPGAVTIVLMTRWHKRDLVGMLLAHEPQKWTVLNLPALAEDNDPLGRVPGEALSVRYPRENLLETRETVGSYWWGALYQGRPTAREGGMFKRDKWRIVSAESVPLDVRRVRSWDLASTRVDENPDPDWTRGMLVASHRDSAGRTRFWYEDLVSIRGSGHEVRELIKKTAEKDGPRVHVHLEQEPGSAGKSQVQDFSMLLSDRVVAADRPTGSKELRADIAASKQEVGTLMMVEGSWNEEAIEEHAEFPTGSHDDIVDAGAAGVTYLASRKTASTGKMKDNRASLRGR